jgi:hypothetical protein
LTPIICQISAVVSALQTISAVVAERGVLQRNYKLDEHSNDREAEFLSGGMEDQILWLFASSDAVTSLLEGARKRRGRSEEVCKGSGTWYRSTHAKKGKYLVSSWLSRGLSCNTRQHRLSTMDTAPTLHKVKRKQEGDRVQGRRGMQERTQRQTGCWESNPSARHQASRLVSKGHKYPRGWRDSPAA